MSIHGNKVFLYDPYQFIHLKLKKRKETDNIDDCPETLMFNISFHYHI